MIPSLARRFNPAKQLWHPVSANAMTVVGLILPCVHDEPRVGAPRSVVMSVVDHLIVGWGCALPFFHVLVRLSNIW